MPGGKGKENLYAKGIIHRTSLGFAHCCKNSILKIILLAWLVRENARALKSPLHNNSLWASLFIPCSDSNLVLNASRCSRGNRCQFYSCGGVFTLARSLTTSQFANVGGYD